MVDSLNIVHQQKMYSNTMTVSRRTENIFESPERQKNSQPVFPAQNLLSL